MVHGVHTTLVQVQLKIPKILKSTILIEKQKEIVMFIGLSTEKVEIIVLDFTWNCNNALKQCKCLCNNTIGKKWIWI